EFFRRFGEPVFRAIESQVIAESRARTRVVVATGGGAVLAAENWSAWRAGSVVIGLTAAPEILVDRVHNQAAAEGGVAERPLLAGDAIERMRTLLAARSHLYRAADATVDTGCLDPSSTCEAVMAAIEETARGGRVPFVSLATSGERSDIYVGPGLVDAIGEMAATRWPRAKRVWIVTDEHVGNAWGQQVMSSQANAGLETRRLTISAGEASKSLSVVERLCDEMTTGGVTRRDIVVALGGGVVGDVAGFVASICLRGLSLVQAPTSLLAMVDSSIGGKTGVNLPAGKNLVGAFYQPGLVIVDPDLLTTLSTAEYRSGMAEVIKHALIQPSTPLGGRDLLDSLASLDIDPIPAGNLTGVLKRNISIKHSVVQNDERESGLRMILNFGHTAGHAIEADGYRYRHGEAVALGMLVASRVARSLGRVNDDYLTMVERLIARSGLPTRVEGRAEDIFSRLARDKKNVDGALHWILPRPDGIVEPTTSVSLDLVRSALIEIGAS
ncbi:MAG: 3-dehydroquinate synthase, partial [Vicinamibacterales bacterium]